MSGTNSWTGTNTYNSNLPTSTITATSGNQLSNFTSLNYYMGQNISNLLAGINVWTNQNSFSNYAPTTAITATTTTQICNVTATNALIATGLTNFSTTANAWTGNTNTYNSHLPTSTVMAVNLTDMMTLQSTRADLLNGYNKSIRVLDDFYEGFTNNPWAWGNSGSGTTSVVTGIQNHSGIIRLGVGSGQNCGIAPSLASNIFFWANVQQLEFVFRMAIGTDASCTIQLGMVTSYTVFTNSVLWEFTTPAPGYYQAFLTVQLNLQLSIYQLVQLRHMLVIGYMPVLHKHQTVLIFSCMILLQVIKIHIHILVEQLVEP